MSNPWDDRYQGEEYYYGTEPNDFLREQTHLIPQGGRVLCLAEGEGRNAVYLAQLGHRVIAVDGSRVGLEKLKAFAKRSGVVVETVHSDLRDFEIQPNTWDAIVSIWCHTPVDLRQKLHVSSVKGLKAGGVFILESYRPKQIEYKTGGPASADLMMNLVDLKEELRGLRLIVGHEMDREIQEGRGHSGISAVVQIAAIRENKRGND
jgi:SAM-dependent methyltransferase